MSISAWRNRRHLYGLDWEARFRRPVMPQSTNPLSGTRQTDRTVDFRIQVHSTDLFQTELTTKKNTENG